MRALKYLRRTSCLRIFQATVNCGQGEITIGNWRGTVVWGNNEHGFEHVSVCPYDRSITPSWDDMCAVKDVFFEPEEEAIQIHPKKSEYVNIMPNCLHLWRPKDQELLKVIEKATIHV